ncbi:hypothetical protein DFJ58DRAFT_729045 [Suillus subalutaceus]|uniref:uncharacterized protein n=1 Tax=Suillus subalutaceus TaxID=48586 RepID=UPI001B85B606|nr:uncharacterized protein DFJ58DRAFT_729045 [Suillus subalutaceus]KAG1851066.1 hypothetical protein DFJ58DRAFT_729045 [Suillus subalutaceus]
MSKCTASESHDDEPTSKRVRNHEGTRAPSPLADHGAWRVLEQYLTTEMTYPQMEAAFSSYLGNQYNADDWKEAHDALFSGNGDNSLTLANLLALKARHIPQGTSSPSKIVTPWKDSALSMPASKAAGRLKSGRVRRPKNPFIDDKASDNDEEEEEEEEDNLQVEGDDGPSVRSLNVTRLPGPSSPKDRLSVAINHIFDRYDGNAPSTCLRAVSSSSVVPSRMYLLHVHRSATQCVAEHLRSNGFAITVSPWIPSQLYAVSDSPRTIATSLKLLSSSMKDYIYISEEEQAAVERSCSTLPNPGWVKITQGKYKGDISYVFDPKQSNDFITVLIPPRDFPYDMPKRSVVLLNRAHLPSDKTVPDILQDDKVVGWSYKGERYYMGLLLKNFRRDSLEPVASPHANDIQLHLQSGWDVPFFKKTLKAFSLQFLHVGDSARPITGEVCSEIGTVISTNHVSGSACLKFTLDGHGQELEFRLQDIERVFWVGDTVRVVAGAYAGLEGHIIKKSGDLFHMCQETTNEEVEVSKYYLDRCPLTHVLQSQPPMQPDFDPLPESESLQIGDEIEVCAGEYMGKCGIVVWFPMGGTTLWFRAGGNIKDQLINAPAAFVQHIHPFKTLQFTKERGYDVKPRDVVTVAHGPEFQTKGIVQTVDFPNARLTQISEGNYSLISTILLKSKTPPPDPVVPSSSSMDPSSSEWSNWTSHNNHDSTNSLSAGVKTYDPWVANNAEDIEDTIADLKEKSRNSSESLT